MSERRRSLFVLLIVAALLAASIVAIALNPTILGLDLKGGVQLVYKAQPTVQQPTITADAMQRSIDLMRQRVNALGVSESDLNQSGQDQIEVNLPGVKDADQAARQVGSTAQLFFYDWEANILDDKCKTDSDINANQRQAINGLRTAVLQASKCTKVGVGAGLTARAGRSPGGPSQPPANPRFDSFNKNSLHPFTNGQAYETLPVGGYGLTS